MNASQDRAWSEFINWLTGRTGYYESGGGIAHAPARAQQADAVVHCSRSAPPDSNKTIVDVVARLLYEAAAPEARVHGETWEEIGESIKTLIRHDAKLAILATIEWLAITPMENATPGFSVAFRRLMSRKCDEIEVQSSESRHDRP